MRQLVEDFARYLYLSRLAKPDVLVQSIRDGVALLTWQSETFAYAEGYDEARNRYRGLRTGQSVNVGVDDAGLVVKPDVARRQIEMETPESVPVVGDSGVSAPGTGGAAGDLEPTPGPRLPRRFHGTIKLDPARVGRDAGKVAEEVIAHLVGQPGAEVTVTLEIDARLPDGANEQIVRTVTENSRTLKFSSHEFENE